MADVTPAPDLGPAEEAKAERAAWKARERERRAPREGELQDELQNIDVIEAFDRADVEERNA